MFVYPPELPSILTSLRNGSSTSAECIPNDELLRALAGVAYHASFLTEEGRRSPFRVAYCTPDFCAQSCNFDELGCRLTRLIQPRQYTVEEINRIAPAVTLTQYIICVRPGGDAADDLMIWALIDVGENSWDWVTDTGGSLGAVPPPCLTITANEPGRLAFSLSGAVLFTLKSGDISLPTDNPFYFGEIADFLNRHHYCLGRAACDLLGQGDGAWPADSDRAQRVYTAFLARVLQKMREQQHGGTLLMVSSEVPDEELKQQLRFKYETKVDHAWGSLCRWMVNYVKRWEFGDDPEHSQPSDLKDLFSEQDELERNLDSLVLSIASLTLVDGAVVVDTRFTLLGFGCEILSKDAPPSLRNGEDTNTRVGYDSFGTRHRSAFRFCYSLQNALAFIVSSDGGVRAVRRVDDDVLVWLDINNGRFGL